MENVCNIINVFTVTFEDFNASLLNTKMVAFYSLDYNTKLQVLQVQTTLKHWSKTNVLYDLGYINRKVK